VRSHFQNLGLAKDEFQDHDNWPHQLYIREARRLVSEYVMTQHHCQGRTVCEDPVGMGAYNMDSHNVHRYVTKEGFVRNEGDIQVPVSPYPIAYRSIRPRKAECENLLVPVCLAASHIAYGSIRMEPVFMVLGQSAATAASQALEDQVAVQDIDYAKLKVRLLQDQQVLAWSGPVRTTGVEPKSLPGTVVDNVAAKLVGDWQHSSSLGGYVGTEYLHDGNTEKGKKTATFVIDVAKAGSYDVRVAYTANPNRATNVPIRLQSKSVSKDVVLNQRETPAETGFQPIAKVDLKAPESITIVVTNEGTDGYVIVDAVQIVAASAK
jgi:hypothetical protein